MTDLNSFGVSKEGMDIHSGFASARQQKTELSKTVLSIKIEQNKNIYFCSMFLGLLND